MKCEYFSRFYRENKRNLNQQEGHWMFLLNPVHIILRSFSAITGTIFLSYNGGAGSVEFQEAVWDSGELFILPFSHIVNIYHGT